PGGATHGRQHLLRLDLADVAQRIFQHTLLYGHLRGGRQMLHGAAAALPEITTGWLDALRRGFEHALGACHVERGLAPGNMHLYALARQGTFDKDHFAVTVRHAPGFEIQGLNIKYFGHKNNWAARKSQERIV